jgi:transposase
MISKELQAEILRLHGAEDWPTGTIAHHLGVHHEVVERVVHEQGTPAPVRIRSRKINPYLPFLEEKLRQYPKLVASALYRMCKERGYRGSERQLRHYVSRMRPRPPAEAFFRLQTLPGEQGQVDWAHFGQVKVGRAIRKLMAFVLVLSFSRHIFLRFFLQIKAEQFLEGHQEAFQYFKGVPRVLLYDNLKSCVLERYGDAIRFHPKLLEFAGHYRFEPRPVGVYRVN